jgi:hypothetical protein
MLHKIATTAGAALYKRASPGEPTDDPRQVSGWALLVLLLNLIVFIPVFVYMIYTLGQLFPVLAIIENTDPPAYEPVSLNEDSHTDTSDPNAAPKNDNAARAGKPISSSLRSLDRLLRSVGGWRANFRGLVPCLAYIFAVSVVGAVFESLPLVPSFVGTLLASLALVQLSAAWVHIAVSPPNASPFWRRLPPFRKTFEATWIPTVVAWLAATVYVYIPTLMAWVLNLPLYDPSTPGEVPVYDRHAVWKVLVLMLVSLAAWAILIVPSEVLQVRVQASLLPPDEDAIIPFDRTYSGTLEPAIVGKGYVSARDAIMTFPRASWIRIYILHAKIFGVVFGMYLLMLAVMIPQVVLLRPS